MKIESFVSQALEQLGAGIEKVKDKPGIRISPIPYTDPSSNLAGGRLIDSQGNGAIIVFVQFDLSFQSERTDEFDGPLHGSSFTLRPMCRVGTTATCTNHLLESLAFVVRSLCAVE